MTTTQQPDALRLVDKYEIEGFLQDHRFAQNEWCRQAAAELRRLHAENQDLQARVQELGEMARENRSKRIVELEGRIAEMESEAADNARILGASAEKELALRARVEELERELAAIGAGGVEPLRKRAAVKESLTPASTVNQQLTVPTFSPTAQRKLTELQSKGFRVVGYTMEHCNVLQDTRRCTVDYNGLARWVPSAEQEVAKERAARQAAQVEVVELKERIARAGVEQRRAVLAEREACAKACEGLEANRDWVPGSLWGNVRSEMAAAIRARQ